MTISLEDIFERNRKTLEEKIKRDIEKRDPAYIEDQERKSKNTKPDFYVNNNNPGRTIITVGAGTQWFNDLKEMSLRKSETPDPRLNPKHKRDLKVDIARAMDKMYREKRGTSVFHINNNPLAREK